MFNRTEFDAMLEKNGKTKDSVAAMLGLNPATLYRKLNGTSDFTRLEIQTLRFAFGLSAEDVDKIFFAN